MSDNIEENIDVLLEQLVPPEVRAKIKIINSLKKDFVRIDEPLTKNEILKEEVTGLLALISDNSKRKRPNFKDILTKYIKAIDRF